MIVVNRERSGSWLPWTTLILLGLAVVGLLGSSPRSTQALAPEAGVQVFKSVNMVSLLPGQTPYPLYTVTFHNGTAGDVVLGTVTDTLPPGFLFGWMNTTLSDWDLPPSDSVAPDIVWTDDMTVPAGGQLSLVYTVRVPDTVPKDVVPYENKVVARATDGTLVGEATASLIVGQVSLALDKAASPAEVINGQPVTFTITLTNDGEVAGTIDLVTDTLDSTLAFAGLVPGGDLGAPVELPAGTLVWEGPITVPPRSTLTQSYLVDTPSGTDRFQACNSLEIRSTDGAPAPVEACVKVQPERVYLYMPVMHEDFLFAWFSVQKSVLPQAIVAGTDSEVVYTVSIANDGDTTGTLLSIKDTLPAGLTFLGMAPGSEVAVNPSGTTGTITWSGSWPIPPGERLDVIYRVRANVPAGPVANSVVITAREAMVPDEPAVDTLKAEVPIAGLAASNDGPTPKGSPTLLSASVTAGSNVVYTWAFGDETSGTGSSVSHVYPDIQTYQATVTAKNGVSQATATTTVTIKPAVLLEER
ncbi:MAG TPA: PKD domain-containing protein, partial [Anaerolineae bacterium]|nr:PKD domain-containing protein [Anaerolineae bacterium]